MRKPLGKFLWLIFLVVFLILLLTGCGGGGGQPPTPPAPTLSLTISPSQISLYDSATLSWNSKNADSCTASGDWSGSKPLSGSEKVTPTEIGNFKYTLTCTGSGGSISSSVSLTVVNPVPEITDLSPKAVLSGAKGFTLQVFGKKFVPQSKVRVNGQDRQTEFVSDKELRAEILASDVAQAGTLSITIFNPEPGGGLSNTVSFQVTNKIAMAEVADLIFQGDLAEEEARFPDVISNVASKGDRAVLVSADNRTFLVFAKELRGKFLLSEVGSEKLPGIVFTYSGPKTSGGWIFRLRAVGDLNRDGFSDFAFYINVATSDPVNKPGAGRVFVVPGGEWLKDRKSLDLADSSLPIVIFEGEAANDFAGQTFSGGYDFNGDGYDDLAIGNPGERVYLIYGSPSFFGQTSQQKDLGQVGLTIAGTSFTGPIACCGSETLTLVPDQDGDKLAELLIGHSTQNKTYFIYGQSLQGQYSISDLGTKFLGFTIASFDVCSGSNYVPPCNGDFGWTVKGGVIENNSPLIVIGDSSASVRVLNDWAGMVYLFRQTAANGTVLDANSSAQAILQGAENDENASWFLAIGDLRGNGRQDIIVSSPGPEIVRLLSDPLPSGTVELAQVALLTLTGSIPDEHFGWGVAIGDVNGDGIADLMVSAYSNSQAAPKGGAIYVLFGGRGLLAPP